MAVVFDTVGPHVAGMGTTNSNQPISISLSWTHTCSGSNRLIIAAASAGDPTDDTLITVSATCGGTAMTSFAQVHTGASTVGYIQLFYLLNPPAGANTVVLTGGGAGAKQTSHSLTGGSVSFANVNQTTPMDTPATATGNSTLATITKSGTSNGKILFAIAAGSSINSSNQPEGYVHNETTANGAGNSATSVGQGTSVTCNYTVDSVDFWGMVAVNINADTADPGPTPPVTPPLAWYKA